MIWVKRPISATAIFRVLPRSARVFANSHALQNVCNALYNVCKIVHNVCNALQCVMTVNLL